jgi:ankyrin repeat protein
MLKTQYDLVIVIGKDNPNDTSFQDLIAEHNNKTLIIGNGDKEITPEFIEQQLANVQVENAIFISHGYAERRDKGKYNEYSMQPCINKVCQITSGNVHVLGCHSGTSKLIKNNLNQAGNNPTLICHSSRKYITDLDIVTSVAKSLTKFYLEKEQHIPQDLLCKSETIYIVRHNQTEPDKLTAPKLGYPQNKEVTLYNNIANYLKDRNSKLEELFKLNTDKQITADEVYQYISSCLYQFCSRGGEKNYNKITEILENDDIKKRVIDADRSGFTPLHIAALNGNSEVVGKLLDAGADQNKSTHKKESTPLHIGVHEGNSEIVVKLLAAGADQNKSDKNGVTPLHIGVHEGNSEIVVKLLAARADQNKFTSEGVTPLHIAVHNGHLEIVETLLAAGADQNKSNHKKESTPLHIGVHKGNSEIVVKLLDARADQNKSDKNGVTPLHIAAHKGNSEIVVKLLDARADQNKSTKKGSTPLDIATQRGHEIVATFIKEKANEEITLILDQPKSSVSSASGSRKGGGGGQVI